MIRIRQNGKLIFLLCVPLVLTSCVRQIGVTSSTFADPISIPTGFPRGSSFCIVQKQKDNLLFSKEVSRKIAIMLQDRGYSVVDCVEDADYCLHYDFGITSSTSTISVPKYIPGQTQITQGSTHTYGRSSGGYTAYQEETQLSGTTVYVPEEYTFFTREMIIKVYDIHSGIFKKNKRQDQVWQGSAMSCGESSDQREIIDYLLTSVFKHFGKNTKKDIYEKHTEWFGKKSVSITNE